MSPNYTNSSNTTIQSNNTNLELNDKDDDEEPDSYLSDCSELNRRSPSTPVYNPHHLTPRSRPSSPSPRPSFDSGPTRFHSVASSSTSSFSGWLFGSVMEPRTKKKMGKAWYRRRVTVGVVLLVACFFVMNWWMLSRIQDSGRGLKYRFLRANSSTVSIREELRKIGKGKRPTKTIYAKLLAKAAHALAEGQNKPEPKDLWEEPYMLAASSWTPCSEQRDWEPSEGNNGYVMVSANGGINQQRVAVCNAVAVVGLLNATLVLPHFLYSSVWRDVRRSILSTI